MSREEKQEARRQQAEAGISAAEVVEAADNSEWSAADLGGS